MRTLSFNPALLERLVCPLTKGSLAWNAANGELISASAGLAYPVSDGIPVMLPTEARTIKPGIVKDRAPHT
ncbi:conserved hypothetical protein [Mesorhizobium sp. ORS 3359]|nr:conserved hypothetical protein [Mesorhizobium sp. ORS 3359]